MKKIIKCTVIIFITFTLPVLQATEINIDSEPKQEPQTDVSMKAILDTKDDRSNFHDASDLSHPDPCRFVQCPEDNNKEEN